MRFNQPDKLGWSLLDAGLLRSTERRSAKSFLKYPTQQKVNQF